MCTRIYHIITVFQLLCPLVDDITRQVLGILLFALRNQKHFAIDKLLLAEIKVEKLPCPAPCDNILLFNNASVTYVGGISYLLVINRQSLSHDKVSFTLNNQLDIGSFYQNISHIFCRFLYFQVDIPPQPEAYSTCHQFNVTLTLKYSTE